MTTYRLGINTCFAVKRWPEPSEWAKIVREELLLTVVQHSFDLVDLDATQSDRIDQGAAIRRACKANGLELHSTFTGLAAYSSNLLLHPDPQARLRATAWYRKAVDFTALVGASSTGGHIGAYSVADFADPARSSALRAELRMHLDVITRFARQRGLQSFMVENLASAREPATIKDVRHLLTAGDADHVPIVLCLDVGHQCFPGGSGDDLDPYQWLRRLGASAPVVQLQQSDAAADHHWPFTPETNARGRIDAGRVIEALEESGAEEVLLILEIIPPFEADDGEVLDQLKASAAYWHAHLPGAVVH